MTITGFENIPEQYRNGLEQHIGQIRLPVLDIMAIASEWDGDLVALIFDDVQVYIRRINNKGTSNDQS